MRTTLNQIRSYSPCQDGWAKLLRGLNKSAADDEPLWVDEILDHNGLDDALWCLRAVQGYDREMRLYAVWCARRVQHLMRDSRSIAALNVVEQFAHGEASAEDAASARVAARVAAQAARAEAEAEAAWAEEAAAWAAKEWAAEAAGGAAAAVAEVAAESCHTERDAQAEELRRLCRETREAGR
jgi:hypothetical protein